MEILNCFLLAFLTSFALTLFVVHGQDDQSDFISLDCGASDNSSYTDKTTGINYMPDLSFIDSGLSKMISSSYMTNSVPQQFLNLRAFPNGTRNCYTLRPRQGKNQTYLIRASFLYGNYDGENKPPTFDLHLGVDNWTAVTFQDTETPATAEIIHIPSSDFINVCLVQTGPSIPFISALELRLLNNTMYTTESGSLQLYLRLYFNLQTNLQFVRYKDDPYDRIWSPFSQWNVSTISTVSNILNNTYQVPSAVMRSASTPLDDNEPLEFYLDTDNSSDQFYVYMHFAEVELLQPDESREFNIYLNNELWYGLLVPHYLRTTTIYSTSPVSGGLRYDFSINKTWNSTLPPIINAIEVYTVKQFLHMETDETDVLAMLSIKSMYALTRNWQGDPCAPQTFIWDGLNCSYDGFQPPRITSLNLSSSGLNGVIAPSISNLTTIQSLDLSHNNLTGQVPDFLSQMASLKTINLKGNNFTGSIPAQLLEKSKNGLLSLSIDGVDSNTNPYNSGSCKKKNTQIVVPIVASVAAISFLLCG